MVSYNLRCMYRCDGINPFVHCASLILDTFAGKKPDVICFQEATKKNIDRSLHPLSKGV